jgi:hypothetical protein
VPGSASRLFSFLYWKNKPLTTVPKARLELSAQMAESLGEFG